MVEVRARPAKQDNLVRREEVEQAVCENLQRKVGDVAWNVDRRPGGMVSVSKAVRKRSEMDSWDLYVEVWHRRAP